MKEATDMAEQPPENKPSQAMDDWARDLVELFSDPKVHCCRYWLYDPNRQVFYREAFVVELERMFDKEFGFEHHDEDDEPRPAA
jgi:hypothetical protein